MTSILFDASAFAILISLLIFYYRLTRDTNITWFRKLLHAAAVYTVLYCSLFMILLAVQCM